MRNRLWEPANWIIENGLLLLIVAVPLIVVPESYAWNSADGWPGPLVWVGLSLISIPWLLRWLFNGRPTKATLLDAPLVLLLLASGIGLGVSVCPATTLRQLLVLVAGMAIYYGLVNGLRSDTTVWLGVVVWLICGMLLGFVLLVQFAWLRSGSVLSPLLQEFDWLGSIAWAKPALIFMGVWTAMGGPSMILYLAALHGVDPMLYEAAEMDGANAWHRFRHITWPMISPTTFFIFIMSIIGGFQGNFDSVYIITNGGPAGSTITLSYQIYTHAYRLYNMGYAAAMAWLEMRLPRRVNSSSGDAPMKHDRPERNMKMVAFSVRSVSSE